MQYRANLESLRMAETIVAIKLTPHHQGAAQDPSSDDTKAGAEVKYDPSLDLQLRDILSKMFSYHGSMIICFPDLPNKQVRDECLYATH